MDETRAGSAGPLAVNVSTFISLCFRRVANSTIDDEPRSRDRALKNWPASEYWFTKSPEERVFRLAVLAMT
jgi:hypothetical protein